MIFNLEFPSNRFERTASDRASHSRLIELVDESFRANLESSGRFIEERRSK